MKCVIERESSVTEYLGKVACNQLGRMPLPPGTQGGSLGADKYFSLRQKSMYQGTSGLPGARECLCWCTVLLELCLCFEFCSGYALRRKLKFPREG